MKHIKAWREDTRSAGAAGLAGLMSLARRLTHVCLPARNPQAESGASRPPLSSKAGRDALVGQYESQKKLLLSLSSGLEGEFLALGTRLGEILRTSKSLQSECRDLNELLAGRDEEPAIQFSFQLLKKAEDLVLASYEQYGHVFQAFGELSAGLNQLRSLHAQLNRTLRPLPVITIQFRIQAGTFDETARDAFMNLAQEMNALLNEVHKAVQRQYDDLCQIQTTTDRLKAELSQTIHRHKHDIGETLQQCRAQLGSLGEALQRCTVVVQSLSGQSSDIQGGVNSVIRALQTQDITCQKLQHVAMAIDEMVRHLQAPSADSKARSSEAELHHFLAQANLIQSGQTQGVFDQLTAAAAQIVEGIAVVEKRARELADNAVNTGRNAIESAVVERSVQGMREILQIVSSTVANTQEVCSALEPLQSRFTQYTEQISALAMRVRLTALNAQIYAVHVHQGAALEVLAEQTRLISDLILDDVGRLAAQLGGLAAAVENLHERLADFSQLGRQEQTLLGEESKTAEAKLLKVKSDLPRRLENIRPLQQKLSELVRSATAEVAFPARIAEASTVTREFFQRRAQCDELDSMDAHHSVGQHLVRLRQNYTMAQERLVHDAATGIAGTAAAKDIALLLPGESQCRKTNGIIELSPAAEAVFAANGHDAGDANRCQSKPAPPSPSREANLSNGSDLGENIELF